MTVADNYAPAVFTGNGVTTVFPFSFVVYDESHLLVYEQVIATGVRTLISAANYTVSGVPGAGSVTYSPSGVPLPATKKLELVRQVPYTQALDIENQGGFYANTMEDQLDLMVMQTQQLADASADYLELAAAVEAAETAQTAAEAAQTGAVAAKTAAEIAEVNAETAETAAEAARDAALAAQTAAELAKTNAETAETNAETAATNANNSAIAAAASETNAAASAVAAQTAETNAETAETAAELAQTGAVAAQTAAEVAQVAAEAAAASVVASKFNSQATAAAATISALTDFIEVGGLVYQRVSATHPRLGPELMVNGDFASATGWTETGGGTVWSIGSGVATAVPGPGGDGIIYRLATLANGDRVFYSFNVLTRTADSVRAILTGSNTTSAAFTTTGVKTGVLTATGASTGIGLYSSGAFAGTVDDYSAKKLPADAFSSNGGTVWWAQPWVRDNAAMVDEANIFTESQVLNLTVGAAGDRFEIQKIASPVNYSTTKASFVLQHYEDNGASDLANGSKVDNVLFHITDRTQGVTTSSTNSSVITGQGIRVYVDKENDGSAQAFTVAGVLGPNGVDNAKAGANGYNEFGGFQALMTNNGSSNGYISAVEVHVRDSPDDGVNDYPTRMTGIAAGIKKYNASALASYNIHVLNEGGAGSQHLDAILYAETRGNGAWKRGLDLYNDGTWDFSTLVAVQIKEGNKVRWTDGTNHSEIYANANGKFVIDPAGAQVFLTEGGALATPGIAKDDDPNTGLLWNAADDLQIVSGGVARIRALNNNLQLALGAGALKTVTEGAADSGGAGFKLLRVPN